MRVQVRPRASITVAENKNSWHWRMARSFHHTDCLLNGKYKTGENRAKFYADVITVSN
jgi:hypothetical protein